MRRKLYVYYEGGSFEEVLSVNLHPVSPLAYMLTFRGNLVLGIIVVSGEAAVAHKVMGDRGQRGGDGASRGVLAAVAKKGDDDTMKDLDGHPLVLVVDAAVQNGRGLGVLGFPFAGLIEREGGREGERERGREGG